MSWTDERIALLKKMWKEGKSAAEIAKMLAKGVTRNAVIGKAHRMGLSGRPSPIKKPAAAPKKEKEAAPKKEAVKETRSSKSAPAPSAKLNPVMAKEVEELKKIEKEVLPLNGGVPLIDLTERMCKWPIGDPKEDDFTFCGRGIRPGTPYCPDHAAMAYQTSSRSRSPMAANDRSRKAPVKEAVVAEVEEEEEVEDVVEEDDEEVTA
ncbi:MAG: GcrA family cell cycle regulator [bacterium]|nr:GcrA family cell cycle regulator [bacterium]